VIIRFEAGGYRYLRGVFQYSAGVAAEPGFNIERAWLAHPLPLAEGFAAIESHLRSRGRPLAALCACELRSPAPFSEDGFEQFNRSYVGTLERWGIYRDGENPIARTNVCPVLKPPSVPVLAAFSYTGIGGDFLLRVRTRLLGGYWILSSHAISTSGTGETASAVLVGHLLLGVRWIIARHW
jgi:hypothetical protein